MRWYQYAKEASARPHVPPTASFGRVRFGTRARITLVRSKVEVVNEEGSLKAHRSYVTDVAFLDADATQDVTFLPAPCLRLGSTFHFLDVPLLDLRSGRGSWIMDVRSGPEPVELK